MGLQVDVLKREIGQVPFYRLLELFPNNLFFILSLYENRAGFNREVFD